MDREEVARAGRRRQALEALEFERARGEALRERLEVVVTELDGAAIDEAVFAAMSPAEVEVVRPELQPAELEPDLPDEDEEALEDAPPLESAHDLQEAEIARLRGEVAASAERQRAFERYLQLLGGDAGAR